MSKTLFYSSMLKRRKYKRSYHGSKARWSTDIPLRLVVVKNPFSTLEKNQEKKTRVNSGFSSLFVLKECCMETLFRNIFDFFI